MRILIYGAIFFSGSIFAILLCKRFYENDIENMRDDVQRLKTKVSCAHFLYLGILRRELANAILIPKPSSLLEADTVAKEYERKIEEMSDEEFNAELLKFWKRYPDIVDFDLMGVKHFIKYSDSLAFNDGVKKVRKHYLSIVKYMALLCRLEIGSGWKWHRVISTGTDIELLEKCLHRYDDQRLKGLANNAIKNKRLSGKPLFDKYEDEEYTMEPLDENSPASLIGIHIVNSNEYVVYESFLSDDNKHYENFYRSNKDYGKREPLCT